jgi:hypothetical protein
MAFDLEYGLKKSAVLHMGLFGRQEDLSADVSRVYRPFTARVCESGYVSWGP